MAKAQFYIRPADGAKETKVYVKIRIRKKNQQTEIRQAIPEILADVRKWNGLNEDGKPGPKIRGNYEKTDPIFDKLREIEKALNAEIDARPLLLDADKVRDIVDRIARREYYDNLAKEEANRIELANLRREEEARKAEEARKVHLMDFYSEFVADKSKKVAERTVTNYMQGYNRLMDYQRYKGITLDWGDLDKSFFNDYDNFLCTRPDLSGKKDKALKKERKNAVYNDATRHKRFTELRTIVRAARELGITDSIFDTYSFTHVEETKTPENQVYLTRSELDKMLAVDLSALPKGYEQARDIFMVGVWTAQRISDYNNIAPGSIQAGDDGRVYIHIRQTKTSKRVVIPATAELRAILAKYDNQLPHLSDQRINHHIHEIAKLAGLDEPIRTTSTKGGKRQEITVEKYKLISSHTARRTGATLMYLSGMDELDICRITGHESAKMLRNYILADELDVMRTIVAKYDYFD